jgi:glycosyltransferase involved in cell wall biosynthesis
MATYNGEKYLSEQIDSILAQLDVRDELVVSDDGSTDGTMGILRGFGNALRVVGESRVGGVVPNFSRALDHARGELILLADQDDVWLPGRVELFRAELARHDLVLTNALVVDENLRPVGKTLFDQTHPKPGFWRNLRRNSFVGCCMGFRRSLLMTALPLPKVTPWHDWLLGLLASLRGSAVQLDTPLLLYRRHGSNASPTGEGSTNGIVRKAELRVLTLLALAICLFRSRQMRR